MEGTLWIWKDKYWCKRFFVLENGILHCYGCKEQANCKANSATKKNRLPVTDMSVTGIKTSDDEKYEFTVSVLDGRIEWTLAAPSLELRNQWINSLYTNSQVREQNS